MLFSNKAYDILKYFAMVLLPALAVCIRAVFPVWGIPYGEEIYQTLVAINACLGVCLGISTIQYNMRTEGKDE